MEYMTQFISLELVISSSFHARMTAYNSAVWKNVLLELMSTRLKKKAYKPENWTTSYIMSSALPMYPLINSDQELIKVP